MTIKFLFASSLILLLSGCLTGGMKCCDYTGTELISKGLYLERYRTFCGGVFGEATACYITDSIKFRQKIGFYSERETFRAKLISDTIHTYNLESLDIPDTVERVTMSKAKMWRYNHSLKDILNTNPVFGTNTIVCDTNLYLMSSYKTDDGYYRSEVQFKCGDDYSNAIYYTDSINFCMLIGIRSMAAWGDELSLHTKSKDSFECFKVEFNNRIDTVKTQVFPMGELRQAKFTPVCK